MPYSFDLEALNNQFETASPEQILQWAVEQFGDRVVLSSSFQTQSVALLHLVSKVVPQLKVIFVDTGYHFPETLQYRDQLTEMFHLNVVSVRVDDQDRMDQDGEGNPLYVTNPDLCCAVHKTAAMAKGVEGADAWITGIRRDQTATRKGAQYFEHQADGLYKVNALLNWTSRDLWKYINHHDLPTHPLFSQGFMSVGCAPCTRAVEAGGNERDGRWNGRKTECGLHVADLRTSTSVRALA